MLPFFFGAFSLPVANSLRNRRPQMMRPTGSHSSYLVLRGQTFELECIVQGLWVCVCVRIFYSEKVLHSYWPHPFLISSGPLPPSSGWGRMECCLSLVHPVRTPQRNGCCASLTSQSRMMGSTSAQPTTPKAPSHTFIPSLWKVWLCLALNLWAVRTTLTYWFNWAVPKCNIFRDF